MAASRDCGTLSQRWYIGWTSVLSGVSGHDTTVALWARVSGAGGNGVVFWGTTTGGSVWWQVQTSTVFIHSSSFSFSPSIFDDKWHFLMFTSNTSPARRRFYIDGVQVGSAASTGTSLASGGKNWRLGDWIGGSGFSLGGKECHFHFYSRELAAGEGTQIMYYPGSVTDGLEIYTPLNTGQSPERDLSGNGAHGTVTSATVSTDGPPVRLIRPNMVWPVPSAAPPAGARPQGPMGHPLYGALAGPIGP